MKGTRPLSNEEIIEINKHFTGTYEIRNRSLFMLGVSIGGRISEMLSLRIGDVWQNKKPIKDVVFNKHIVKGGEVSRAVPLNEDGRQAVSNLIAWHLKKGEPDPNSPLFPSRKGGRLDRRAADNVMRKTFQAAGLNGKLGTHSLRKSFAQRLYDQTSDIFVVKEMLGHKHTDTTQKYLGVNYRSAREAIEAIAVSVQTLRDTTPVYKATDEALMAEMLRRGYGVSKSPDDHL